MKNRTEITIVIALKYSTLQDSTMWTVKTIHCLPPYAGVNDTVSTLSKLKSIF